MITSSPPISGQRASSACALTFTSVTGECNCALSDRDGQAPVHPTQHAEAIELAEGVPVQHAPQPGSWHGNLALVLPPVARRGQTN